MSTRRVVLAGSVGVVSLTAIIYAQTSTAARDDASTVVAAGDVAVMHAPDRAFVAIAVEAEDGRPRNAERKAAETMGKVDAAIAALALGADAVRTLSFSVQPRFQFPSGRKYIARHAIEVRVDDLAKLGDLLDAAGEARAASIGSLRFDVKDRSRVELETLRLAVKEATERAHAIAAGSGRSIVTVLRVEEHRSASSTPVIGFAADLPMALDRQAAGRGGGQMPTTIEPGEIRIRAQVTLTASAR